MRNPPQRLDNKRKKLYTVIKTETGRSDALITNEQIQILICMSRKEKIFMENMNTAAPGTPEQLLEDIFDITQKLYAEMSRESGTAGGHSAIFKFLTELGRTLANADRASFWKWDKRSHKLWTTAAVGEGRITIPEGTGLVGKALSEKKAIVTNDPYSHPDFNSDVDKQTGYVTKSLLVMPVANCKGEFIGAYQAVNKLDGGGFDLDSDCRRLSLAAFICGITLESDIFFDDSMRDKLTGLKNRTGFYSDWGRKYEQPTENGEEDFKASLIICDIDFFKKVNDTYGHNAGDAVLRHTAGIFSESCPEGAEVYRWGGEEFIVMLPGKDLGEAAETAEELRIKTENSVCLFEELQIKVTMSFGCTELDPGKSIENNISNADEKLYRAKRSGRNIVIA